MQQRSTLEQKDVGLQAGNPAKRLAIPKGLCFALPVFLFAALFSLPVIVLAQAGGYDLSWWTVDGGGATFSTGGTYRLGGTIGQPDAGEHNGGDYTLYGGFWNRDFPLPATPSTDSGTKANSLPDTGFAPGRVTRLSAQPVEKGYTAMSDLWLEIPALGLKMDIVSVPFTDGEWDVSWLGKNAGWLESTAYPTWSGNSVLTAHVWNADNTPGSFVKLNTLQWGDRVIIHSRGQQSIYEVRSVEQVRPTLTASALQHKDTPWLTLLTCRFWDADSGTYRYRVLVQAVLIEVK
jgi:LPXTG-site transpeptidase (sortase) family protein